MSHLSVSRPSPHPRERLSLYTHSTLGHDVSAALKASPPIDINARASSSSSSKAYQETLEAPPPSPVDFGFRHQNQHQHQHQHQHLEPVDDWSLSRTEEGVVGA